MNLHTRRVYSQTGYDVTDYFRLAVMEVQKRSKMPHPTASLLYMWRTVRATITKCYLHIQADMPYIIAGYDVTNYFQSEATAKIRRKCRFMRLQVEFLENGLSEDHQIFSRLSETTGNTNLRDMTSLVTSGGLQNAIKYCTQVTRKRVRPAKE